MRKILLFIVMIFLLSISSVAAQTLIANSTSIAGNVGAYGANLASADGTATRGQSFIVNQTAVPSIISIAIGNSTDSTENFTVHIRLANATGFPTGQDVANGTLPISSIRQVGLTNISLSYSSIFSPSNTYMWYVNTSSGTDFLTFLNDTGMYSQGSVQTSSNAQVTWTPDTTKDLYFMLFGSLAANSSVTTTLISPPNQTNIQTSHYIFNMSAQVIMANLTNATIYIYNSTNDLFYRETKSIFGNSSTAALTTNSTFFNVSLTNFTIGNYKWNVNTCAFGTSGLICDYGEANLTFVVGLRFNNMTFNSNVYETDNETFILNFSYDSSTGLTPSAIFTYNNTNYISRIICSSDNCTASNSIDIPTIASGSTSQNNSFFWTVTIFQGAFSFSSATSANSQIAHRLSLTYCHSVNVSLNYTAYDEQKKTRISPFNFDANYQYYGGSGGVRKTLLISNSSTQEVAVCLNRNATTYIDGIIAYSAPNSSTTYQTRNYFYQRWPITQTVQNTSLFLLNSTASTSFVLKVQDRNILGIGNVLVNAERCYVATNTNETVFIARTDSNGLTVGNFEAEVGLYQFRITNQSNTLLFVTPCSKVVPQTSPFTLLFQLGDDYSSPFSNLANLSDISSNLYYNATSSILTWTYSDTSTDFSSVSLIVRSLNYSGSNEPIVCEQNSTLASGILTCNMSSSGTFTAQAYVTRTNTFLIDQIVFTVNTFTATIGYYGAFLSFFIILISAFAFKFNEIAGIVLVNVAVIFCAAINLLAVGPLFITAMIAISIIIIGVLER